MRFIADESCHYALVGLLRAAGHDVIAVMEDAPGLSDEEVAHRAYQEGRVLVTQDKDFGQLVFAGGVRHHGVILIRHLRLGMNSIFDAVLRLAASPLDDVIGSFFIVQPGRVRRVDQP